MSQKREIPANNLFAIIVLLFIASSALSSYLAYSNSRQIYQELTGKALAEARVCVNKPPTTYQNCSTTATIGVGYYCNVDGNDTDNDTLTFYDNTALFNIDATTGEIIFTPTAADAGAHSIIITASDGKMCSNSNATTAFTITIPGVPGGSGGGGGGGGGGISAECSPQWECTPWSSCRQDRTQERKCYTLNNCPKDKPAEKQGCIYLLPPAPRKTGFKEYYLCNFDMEEECFASFGMREDWVYTYKGKDSTINLLRIDPEGVDVSIDDEILFSAPLERIKPIDVTGDKVNDFEYIPHTVSNGRVEMTVRLIKKVEVVVERPVYIEMLPAFIMAILIFVYNNACLIILMVIILAAMLTYSAIMRRVEEKNKKKQA
jgi:uncharacterized protein YpmB